MLVARYDNDEKKNSLPDMLLVVHIHVKNYHNAT
jgi:hypothetical protein